MFMVGKGTRGANLPSTSTTFGCICKLSIAMVIALRVALCMLILSIVAASIMPKLYAMAVDFILLASFIRWFDDSVFESFTPSIVWPGGRISAQAMTGPAKEPRPASSTPAMGCRPASCSVVSHVVGAVLVLINNDPPGGSNRHIVVDTMGSLLSVVVHAANIHDTKGGIGVAARVFDSYPTIKNFVAMRAIVKRS